MSFNKKQLKFVASIFAAFEIDLPEISKETKSKLIKAFAVFSKVKKDTDPARPKRPGNVYIAWLNLNRETIKTRNGGEEVGLADLLSAEYKKFEKTSDHALLKKDCADKMKVYQAEKQKYDESKEASEDATSEDDDDKPKKAKSKKAKAKKAKAEKSPEEKQPLNVYMEYRRLHLNSIKESKDEDETLSDALKKSYAAFQKTNEFKISEKECKEKLTAWRLLKSDASDASDASESEKTKTSEKTKAAKKPQKKPEPVSDSDDEENFTMPKSNVVLSDSDDDDEPVAKTKPVVATKTKPVTKKTKKTKVPTSDEEDD